MSHRFTDESESETHALGFMDDAVSVQQFVLRVVAGQDQGTSATADGEEMSIGTSAGNQLIVSDPTVSRHHCTLTAGSRGIVLRDLESTNGTLLGGYPVTEAILGHGATFTLGQTTVQVEVTHDQVRAPLSPADRFAGVLGRSASMRKIFAMLPRIAGADVGVLIEGETGTGKSLLAGAIHESSPRSKRPFQVLDCGAVTSTLIESQLFGHEKGAFTGAQERRDGAFVAAEGGTIFLDEIGELPLDLQPKLLRVLEERVVMPVGSTEPVPVDCRVIAATNRDLREAVNKGTFRADLFFRLAVMRLRIPPLRERPEDVELLCHHFYEQLSPQQPVPPPAWLARWKGQRWPGNVRELRAAIERAVLLGEALLDHGTPTAVAGPASASGGPDLSLPFRRAKDAVVAQFERNYLGGLIAQHQGNVSAAARAARMDRNHLRELLRRHDIDPKR